jgi:hypothetical protein
MKAEYVLRNKLAGMGHWGLLDDDFAGKSCKPKGLTYPRLRSINYVFSIGMTDSKSNEIFIFCGKEVLCYNSHLFLYSLAEYIADFSLTTKYPAGAISLTVVLVLLVFLVKRRRTVLLQQKSV